jgi:hypothetical protein
LSLLDEVPSELIDLPSREYVELSRCRAVLATTLARWNVGDDAHWAKEVGGKDPIERIRRLILQCHDQFPPPEPELPFIADMDLRLGIEDQIRAAWTNFNAREWMGATVFAGTALEALLLWAVKHKSQGRAGKGMRRKSFDEMYLSELIQEAEANRLVSAETRSQACLATDARNLLHPGKVARSGVACSKATALTALAGVYRVADDLKRTLKGQ